MQLHSSPEIHKIDTKKLFDTILTFMIYIQIVGILFRGNGLINNNCPWFYSIAAIRVVI